MRYKVFYCLLLAIFLLTSCTGRDSQSETPSISEPSVSVSDEASTLSSSTEEDSLPERIDAPVVELAVPGQITVYVKNPNSDIFTPYVIPAQDSLLKNITLLELVSAVEDQLQIEIPVLSITQRKGMVVIDLAGHFIEDYAKSQVEQILTTLAATLQQNHRTFEWIQYQLDGVVGVFGEQYTIPSLKLLEEDPEEFAAIRAQIPYEGLNIYPAQSILETDDIGKKLIEYLSLLDLPTNTVTTLADIKNDHILQTAVFATKHYETYPDSENYKPELKPFEAPASELLGFVEQWFWLKEHVEESARLLYGEDVSLVHGDFGKYRYLDLLGVYTPPHMGGGGQTIPVIFGYEESGNRLRAEVAYVVAGMGGYLDPETWEEIPQDQLKEYVQTKSIRYEVAVKKTAGNWFLLESQRPID